MTDTTLAIVLADLEGRIAYWNDDARTLFGYDAAEALGATLDLIVPPDYREAHWKAFHAATASGEGRLDGQATHLPVLCRDGEVRAFPGRFHLVRDPWGRVVTALGTFSEPAGAVPPWTPLGPVPA